MLVPTLFQHQLSPEKVGCLMNHESESWLQGAEEWYWLVVSTPPKNIKISWDYCSQYIWKNKKMFQTTNQDRSNILIQSLHSPCGCFNSYPSIATVSTNVKFGYIISWLYHQPNISLSEKRILSFHPIKFVIIFPYLPIKKNVNWWYPLVN